MVVKVILSLCHQYIRTYGTRFRSYYDIVVFVWVFQLSAIKSNVNIKALNEMLDAYVFVGCDAVFNVCKCKFRGKFERWKSFDSNDFIFLVWTGEQSCEHCPFVSFTSKSSKFEHLFERFFSPSSAFYAFQSVFLNIFPPDYFFKYHIIYWLPDRCLITSIFQTLIK